MDRHYTLAGSSAFLRFEELEIENTVEPLLESMVSWEELELPSVTEALYNGLLGAFSGARMRSLSCRCPALGSNFLRQIKIRRYGFTIPSYFVYGLRKRYFCRFCV